MVNPVKEYFFLQYKMTNRKIRDAGISPVIGYVLGAAGFILISAFAFHKTGFAKYLVLLTVLSLLIKMSERNRSEFLMIVFGEIKTRKIRIAENLLISLPFLILLVYHEALLESVVLISSSVLLASFSCKARFNYSIPTPFYKHPFEFTAGFRKTFYVFPIAYLLTFIAISVDNLNLGIFAMLIIFLVALSYYIKPENEYYVWSYAASPVKFLYGKLKIASWYSSLSALPVLIGLIAFYPGEAAFILKFFLVGLIFLWTIILAKYSAYPHEMNLPEIILIAICIYFPPALLALIPFFFIKSVKKLNTLLK